MTFVWTNHSLIAETQTLRLCLPTCYQTLCIAGTTIVVDSHAGNSWLILSLDYPYATNYQVPFLCNLILPCFHHPGRTPCISYLRLYTSASDPSDANLPSNLSLFCWQGILLSLKCQVLPHSALLTVEDWVSVISILWRYVLVFFWASSDQIPLKSSWTFQTHADLFYFFK